MGYTPTTDEVAFSTYLGGSGDDRATAAVLQSNALIVVAGNTTSGDFPVTSGAAQSKPGGSSEYLPQPGDRLVVRGGKLVFRRFERAAKGNLRIAHIQRIRRDSLQSGLNGKGIPGVGTLLSARDRKEPKSRLIQQVGAGYMCPSGGAVDGMRAETPPKPRQEGLLQDSRSEWIGLTSVEQRAAKIRDVFLSELMIETRAVIVGINPLGGRVTQV